MNVLIKGDKWNWAKECVTDNIKGDIELLEPSSKEIDKLISGDQILVLKTLNVNDFVYGFSHTKIAAILSHENSEIKVPGKIYGVIANCGEVQSKLNEIIDCQHKLLAMIKEKK